MRACRERKEAVSRRKAELLSQSDVDEIVKFQQYLADLQTLSKPEFYRKYQDYMDLSDAELAAALEKGKPRGD
jgi:hypothetical protein